MKELIERQAAVEVADAIWTVTGDKNVAKVWQQIKDLPPAKPRKGKWTLIETYEGIEAKCSCCSFRLLVNEPGNGLRMVDDLQFCPGCGADMRGEEE